MPRIIIALLFALLALPAAADTTITYQGQLQDSGQPFNGQVDLTFELFDDFDANDPSVGNSVAGPLTVNDVQVTDGLFQVDLDFGAVYEQPVWIEITVGTDTLHPRQRLTSAPVAVRALNVSSTAGAWMLGGNAGTDPASDFVGTIDATPFEIRVDGQRALRIQAGSSQGKTPNWIGGHSANAVLANINGVTIAGGGTSTKPNVVSGTNGTIGGGVDNEVSASDATIGGGYSNAASGIGATIGGGQSNAASGTDTTIAGGLHNIAEGFRATIGGGEFNTASGSHSSVLGGFENEALGDNSFAAGLRSKAIHHGSFVWADGIDSAFESTGQDQFRVRANGGADFRLGSNGLTAFSESGNTSGAAIQAESTHTSGIALVGRNDSDDATLVLNNRGTGSLIKAFTGGALLLELHNSGNMTIAGTLTENSDRNTKEAIQPVDNQQILQKLADLDITTWRYKDSLEEVRHIGPMAQDFHALFGFGQSSTTISGMDVRGVALAAIQALHEDNLAMKDRLDELEAKNAKLQALAERNSELEQRLSALEALLVEGKSVVGVNQ